MEHIQACTGEWMGGASKGSDWNTMFPFLLHLIQPREEYATQKEGRQALQGKTINRRRKDMNNSFLFPFCFEIGRQRVGRLYARPRSSRLAEEEVGMNQEKRSPTEVTKRRLKAAWLGVHGRLVVPREEKTTNYVGSISGSVWAEYYILGSNGDTRFTFIFVIVVVEEGSQVECNLCRCASWPYYVK